LTDLYGETIEKLVQKGWLIKDDTSICLTAEGMLFGNDVFAEILLDHEDMEHAH